MLDCLSFQAQLTSIMEVLAKAAVAEIVKLVDDYSSSLRSEMSQSQNEIETLRGILGVMESQRKTAPARGKKRTRPGVRITGHNRSTLTPPEREKAQLTRNIIKEQKYPQWKDVELTVVKEEANQLCNVSPKDEVTDTEESRLDALSTANWHMRIVNPGVQICCEKSTELFQLEEHRCTVVDNQSKPDRLLMEESGNKNGENRKVWSASENSTEAFKYRTCEYEYGTDHTVGQRHNDLGGSGPDVTYGGAQTEELALQSGHQQPRLLSVKKMALQSGNRQPKLLSTEEVALQSGHQQSRLLSTEEMAIQSGHQQSRLLTSEEMALQSGQQQPQLLSTEEVALQSGHQQSRLLTPEEMTIQSGQLTTEEMALQSGHQLSRCLTTEEDTAVSIPDFANKIPGRIVTVKKKNICMYCGKSFPFLSFLKRHLRNHTGERPFCCTLCGRSYTRQSHLNRHKKIHIREKPFASAQQGNNLAHLSDHNKVYTTSHLQK